MSNYPPPPPPTDTKLASIKTYILIAWIFSIIAMIAFALGAVSYIITFATFSTLTFGYGLGFFSGIFIVYAVVFLVLAVMSFMVFMRVCKMYKAVYAGDIATLKATSNVLWAIIALIFAGVIPGIMIIISDGPIKQL